MEKINWQDRYERLIAYVVAAHYTGEINIYTTGLWLSLPPEITQDIIAGLHDIDEYKSARTGSCIRVGDGDGDSPF